MNPTTLSPQHHYPFGMLTPGRNWSSGSEYRFGFNSKESDSETYGDGNIYDYGFRIYNPRLGKFLSVDPLIKTYPMLTPYQFASNTPIAAIDLDGLESEIKIIKNTYFIELKNVDFSFVIRNSDQYFTQAAGNRSNYEDFGINTQLFDKNVNDLKYYTASTPQPSNDYTPQGFNVVDGVNIKGRSSNNTFYFSESNSCGWSCGSGDVPKDSRFGFGGGIPLIVNGLKYGETNLYSKDAPDNLPVTGSTGHNNEKYLVQRSNNGFKSQNAKDLTTGKTILGFNSQTDKWMIVSQQDGKTGMSYSQIRDYYYKLGYDNVLGFDGSSSSTLTQDGNTLVKPKSYKNSSIPTGLNLSVPYK
ncbi:MAG: phosphodiester glycosidase family protein [Chitinophagales bacterium]|nr:phosphodiester glycosidase family protein [Chitinophagales bacterium]MBP9705226.1 phosphodiester glycosidase family protein [Chitinophagales bacterium]